MKPNAYWGFICWVSLRSTQPTSFDAESKLHYNHTRYFQPRTGRYLQPDLIGLEGGINVYTYAGGNPVMFMDPTGTFWETSDGTASDGGLMGMIGSFIDSALSMFDNWAGGTIGEGMTTAGAFYDLPQASVPFLTLGEFGAAKGAAGAVTQVEQYALRAAGDGFYPVMQRGFAEAQEITWMNEGEVWKFGTTQNPATRYSQSYLNNTGSGLKYTSEFSGSLGEASALERMKILNYRGQNGILPPGNKIVK